MLNRRWFVGVAVNLLALARLGKPASSQEKPTVDAGRSFEKQVMKDMFGHDPSKVAKADFSKLPFQIIETTGSEALTQWEKLKATGNGIPVILGGDTEQNLTEPWYGSDEVEDSATILADAEKHYKVFSLAAMRKEETEQAMEELKKLGHEMEDKEEFFPDTGDWPDQADRLMAPTVAMDVLSNEPLPRVYIAIIPAKTTYEIPAYLRWGGWNANPHAMAHVIMLRRWHEKYGAEVVAMTADVINLRVKIRPASREEALGLAKEMYLYCGDIIEQGYGELAPLAASLMESDYWYFWWD